MSKHKKSSRKHADPSLHGSSPSLLPHLPAEEVRAQGKGLREKCPREAHGRWHPSDARPDPLSLLVESNKGRLPELVPVRHGRMLKSPFTYFRGAALSMAADLATTPSTGVRVQACGDAHLLNFGAYATPERRIAFDINDLDETLPAPWEWDVKRLATSFVLACRDGGFSEDDARDAALTCVRSYREWMARYSAMSVLEVWYASVDVDALMAATKDEETRKRIQKRVAKARQRSVLEHDFPELVLNNGVQPQIKDNPPLIFHQREQSQADFTDNFRRAFERYRETLQEDRRLLLDRYKVVDFAMKVVGVGSVGTACSIILLMASDSDPLFLQVKQANASVLEPYAGKSLHANHGQRVVHGCRMMQSASDIFLGWTEGDLGRQVYIRQLKDMKIKTMIEVFTPSIMQEYAAVCGWTLAHAHARSGEPTKISGYLGKSDAFDEAIADFARAYADQSEQDHEVLVKAVRAGKIDVFTEQE